MTDESGMTIAVVFVVVILAMALSGFYAMTSLPYADLIRSWWL